MLPLTLLLLGDVLKYQLYDGTSCYDSSHTPDVGILLEDAALRTCSPAHCTSDDGEGGEDCHAGQRYEGTDNSVSDGMLTAAGITFTEITTQPYTYVIVESPTPPPPTPPTPTPPRTPPPAADGSAVLGIIVGAAVGGLVFLVLVITIPIVVVCCCCMKKKEVAPSA